VPFTIPEDVPRHGCFRVTSYPRFTPPVGILANVTDSQDPRSVVKSVSGQSNTRQVNRDSRMPPPCPPEGDPMSVRGDRFAALRSLFRSEFPDDNRLPRTTTDSTIISIGGESGSSIQLYTRAFMPTGWTYTLSDSGLVNAPCDIVITIEHPVPVACADTARVIVYAYAPGDLYAGDAEAVVYAIGARGDVNFSNTVDSLDVFEFTTWLLGTGPEPVNPDGMELNGDATVDIADLVRLVDHVYAGEPLSCIESEATAPYELGYEHVNDSTYVYLDATRSIRGLQLVFEGAGASAPVSSLPTGIEIAWGAVDESLTVVAADLDGATPLTGSLGFKFAGIYSFVRGIAADSDYGSNVVNVDVVAVPGEQIVTEAALMVFPSPAVDQIGVHYALPARTSLDVSIFDVGGRLVRSLIKGDADAGWHEVVWDRRTDNGRRLSAGVYFVRMIIGGAEQSMIRQTVVLIQ
jgi:hypothetical protein